MKKLNELVQYWVEDGHTKDRALRVLCQARLAMGNGKGKGNAAQRRIDRLDFEAEARRQTQEWFESRMLAEADVDRLAEEYDR